MRLKLRKEKEKKEGEKKQEGGKGREEVPTAT
jgi:hypothetical protein